MRTQSSNGEMFGSTLLYGLVIVLLAAVVSAMFTIGGESSGGRTAAPASHPAQTAQLEITARSAHS